MYSYLIHKMGTPTRVFDKIDRAREDVLTSCVIGAMKYLPREVFFDRFIEELGLCSNLFSDFSIQLWPKWSAKDVDQVPKETVEPDWLIKGKETVIVGEAKFGSPLNRKQLENEENVAEEEFPDSNKIIVTVTNHVVDMKKTEGNENWYWYGWLKFYLLIREALADDLVADENKYFLEDLREVLRSFGIQPIKLVNKKIKVNPIKIPELSFGNDSLTDNIVYHEEFLQKLQDLKVNRVNLFPVWSE